MIEIFRGILGDFLLLLEAFMIVSGRTNKTYRFLKSFKKYFKSYYYLEEGPCKDDL